MPNVQSDIEIELYSVKCRPEINNKKQLKNYGKRK